MIVEKTNLLAISHGAERSRCVVYLGGDGPQFKWLVLGETSLQHLENDDVWRLKAYVKDGATDFEHDLAHVVRLPLIGLRLKYTISHVSHFTAFVDPTADDGQFGNFAVPRSGYDPLARRDTVECTDEHCGDKHRIVAEDYFIPPFDKELWEAVRGKRVEILIGPAERFSE